MTRRRLGLVCMTLGAAALTLVVAIAVFAMRSDTNQQPKQAVADPHAVTDSIISFFADRVQRDPIDYVSYTKLGDAYIRQARETGDISAYQRAQAAFNKALELLPGDLDAQAGLASVLFSLHDFVHARSIAQQVYNTDASATQGLAIVGDASAALGDYNAAYDAYGKLSAVASGSAIFSRLSQLAELRGDVDHAITLMKDAEQGATAKSRSPETLAFYRLQLGNLYLNSGRYDDAEHWYTKALDAFPSYHLALAGLGNVEAARGRYSEAIARYQQSVAVVPLPIVLAALGDAYARVGDTEAARKQYATVEFIGHLAEINRTVYNRELALFYADHDMNTATAVDLGLTELNVRKDVYGYDAAAWALYKDGRAAQAAPLMEQALALGTKDARFFFHAGMIAKALGQDARAQDYLQRALKTNPHFSVLQEPLAREALAQLTNGGKLADAKP